MTRPKERFCKRGHDTEEVGRIRKGWCRSCAEMADAVGGITGKSKHNHSLEWERARVIGWLEIVADDPIDINLKSTQRRKREFEVRYERLEAGVPTPVDA